MSEIDFDMSEVTKLAADLAIAPVKATVKSSAMLTAVAAAAAADARTDVAVDTGDTKASIRVTTDGDSRVITADSRAAFFLEFGTSDTSPQPFLWSQAPRAAQRLQAALEGIDPFSI